MYIWRPLDEFSSINVPWGWGISDGPNPEVESLVSGVEAQSFTVG